jgi:hypothetical protein
MFATPLGAWFAILLTIAVLKINKAYPTRPIFTPVYSGGMVSLIPLSLLNLLSLLCADLAEEPSKMAEPGLDSNY